MLLIDVNYTSPYQALRVMLTLLSFTSESLRQVERRECLLPYQRTGSADRVVMLRCEPEIHLPPLFLRYSDHDDN